MLVVFPENERGKAIGIWAAMAGIGGPIGILVGGWAVENYDWQMVFLINVPFIIVALILGFFIIPKSKDESGKPLDIIGAILSVISLGFLLYAIIEGPNFGWTSFGVSIVFGRHIIWIDFPLLGKIKSNTHFYHLNSLSREKIHYWINRNFIYDVRNVIIHLHANAPFPVS